MIPNGNSKFGENMLPFWMDKIEPHILITLADVWMTSYIHKLPLKQCRWIRYIPLDSEIMLEGWRQQIQRTDQPVLFAEFANKLVEDTCGVKCKNIPHGVNTNVFRPLPAGKQMKAKQNAGFEPDDFVVSFVGRNQIRKMQPFFFKAFAEFAKDKPDAKLLLHMDIIDEQLGWNLTNIFHLLNIQSKVVKSVPHDGFQYKFDVNETKMNILYNISDLHYHSGNEGFGIPGMEANAAGVPNIAPDYTTSKEITNYGSCGYLVKRDPNNWIHPVGAEWCFPDHKDTVKWLNFAYENRDDLAELGKKARAYATSKYDWKIVAPQWVDYIKWVLENPPKVNYKTQECGV